MSRRRRQLRERLRQWPLVGPGLGGCEGELGRVWAELCGGSTRRFSVLKMGNIGNIVRRKMLPFSREPVRGLGKNSLSA